MQEMLDVLNENGVKTGEILSRSEIHQKGLWHRIAIACIVNSDNKLLLQRRSLSCKKFPGMWDLSVASHVQSGEDSVITLAREINEEIGVQISHKAQVKDFRFLISFKNQHYVDDIIENQYYDLFVYRRDLAPEDLEFNDNEVMEVKWCTYTEVLKFIKEGVMHPRLEWFDEVIKHINRF